MKKVEDMYYVFFFENGELTTVLVREVTWKRENHYGIELFQRYRENSKHNSFFSSFGNFSNENPFVVEKYSYEY